MIHCFPFDSIQEISFRVVGISFSVEGKQINGTIFQYQLHRATFASVVNKYDHKKLLTRFSRVSRLLHLLFDVVKLLLPTTATTFYYVCFFNLSYPFQNTEKVLREDTSRIVQSSSVETGIYEHISRILNC